MTDPSLDFEGMLSEFQRKFPFKVLYLEDDVQSAERLRDLFEDQGLDFMIAPSPEEADELLKQSDPDLVITDLRLGEQATNGEAWIVGRMEQLRSAKKVLLTGYATEIINRPFLREAGVEIISKGEPEEEHLWEQMRRSPREKAARLIKQAADEVVQGDTGEEPSLLEPVLNGPLKRLFLKWAEGFDDKDSALIYFGPRTYSVKDLIREVEQGTEIGATIVEMFIEDLEDLI